MLLKLEQDEAGGLTATVDSVDQGVEGIPVATATMTDGNLHLDLPAIGATYEGSLQIEGPTFKGQWKQGGQSFPLNFELQSEPMKKGRSQDPVGPFPYSTEEVTFTNTEDNILLSGTLTLPEGEGPFPAVVLMTGSGPQDRDQALMGHRPFLVIADHLARNGIASLRYDDRGFADSQGNHINSTIHQFAKDGVSAVRFLSDVEIVDSSKIGILGHSEGGLTGPMASIQESAVSFLVLLAPPGEPLPQLLQRQNNAIMRSRGVSEELIEILNQDAEENFALFLDTEKTQRELAMAIVEAGKKQLEKLTPEQRKTLGLTEQTAIQNAQMLSTNWFRSLFAAQPSDVFEKIQIPTLALFAGNDLQVIPEVNAQALEDALNSAGNQDYSIETFDGLNHLFQTSETGSPLEYSRIEETISPEVLERVSSWINTRY
jgi:pimeloyl-ACP methyl ester carboxylesterase